MKGVAPHVGFYALLATHRPAVICDVGSLDGQQALRFKRICPKADVIAFEANPSSCEHIRQNVQGSGVVVEHLAASNKQGRVDFHAVQERPEVSSLLDRTDDLATTTAPVDAVRLDQYLETRAGPVALWIDVEGAADEALEGASGLRDRIVAVHIELETRTHLWTGQPSATAALERLRSWGLELAGRSAVVDGVQYDYLLVRPDGLGTRVALLAASADTLSRRLLPNRPWPLRVAVATGLLAALVWLMR